MDGPPYINKYSSSYVLTSMYIQPENVAAPAIHEVIYAEIADHLDYAPLLIKLGSVHAPMRADNSTPAGVLSVPHSLAEQSDMDRLPDEKDFLIAKEGGAAIVSNLFPETLTGGEE
jgi:hypothetical protein